MKPNMKIQGGHHALNVDKVKLITRVSKEKLGEKSDWLSFISDTLVV